MVFTGLHENKATGERNALLIRIPACPRSPAFTAVPLSDPPPPPPSEAEDSDRDVSSDSSMR
ncbi:hypothetical protein GH733_014597 [Mirounga leonina]|nr:hypothetical protein GH733_014597 [Mirounga leonina]